MFAPLGLFNRFRLNYLPSGAGPSSESEGFLPKIDFINLSFFLFRFFNYLSRAELRSVSEELLLITLASPQKIGYVILSRKINNK